MATPSWAERAAERSPSVQESRSRSVQRATAIVAAARRLIAVKGSDFTTQELAREAKVAVQTFYNHFASKDHLLLAVIEDLVGEFCAEYELRARALPDPLARLRFYVASVVGLLGSAGEEGNVGARFTTSEHWRLARLYPEELSRANRQLTHLLSAEVVSANEAGLLKSANPEYDAWLVTQLIMAVFHNYAFAPLDAPIDDIIERVWGFCLAALGGPVERAEPARKPVRQRRVS